MLYPPRRLMTNALPIISLRLMHRHVLRVDVRRRYLASASKPKWFRRQAVLSLRVLLREDRTIFLDALQWPGKPSERLGRSGKKRRRTGRTAASCERQSSSQDAT